MISAWKGLNLPGSTDLIARCSASLRAKYSCCTGRSGDFPLSHGAQFIQSTVAVTVRVAVYMKVFIRLNMICSKSNYIQVIVATWTFLNTWTNIIVFSLSRKDYIPFNHLWTYDRILETDQKADKRMTFHWYKKIIKNRVCFWRYSLNFRWQGGINFISHLQVRSQGDNIE